MSRGWFECGGRVSARQPTYFLVPESRQRAGPYCPRPSGFACGQPAPSSSWGCAAQLTSRQAASFRQTAASQSTKLLHSAVQQPAPRTCRHRRGHKGQYRMRVRDSFNMFLIAASLFTIWTKSQFRHKSCRPPAPVPAPVSTPCVRACGMLLGLRALAPKSANALCSDLRQRV